MWKQCLAMRNRYSNLIVLIEFIVYDFIVCIYFIRCQMLSFSENLSTGNFLLPLIVFPEIHINLSFCYLFLIVKNHISSQSTALFILVFRTISVI